MKNTVKPLKMLLGICGCVQAESSVHFLKAVLDKFPDLEIEVVATPNASKFFDVTQIEALIEKKIYTGHLDQDTRFEVPHIQLSQWADFAVVYPVSANTLSKLAMGMCDNLLTNVLMAFQKDILIGPCMNDNMFINPFVQENIHKLEKHNYQSIPRVPHPVYIHAEKKKFIKDYCSVDSAVLTTLKTILKLQSS